MKNFVKKTAATTLSVLGVLSAMPSAFCAPEGANNNPPANNDRGHIDPFNMMVVGKYLDSVKDICNLTMVNKKYGDKRNDIIKRYHFNPVAITSRKQLALYPNMETCYLGKIRYGEDFIPTFPNEEIIELVYLPGSFDVNQFEEVVNKNELNNADIWIREFRLENENPMDGCRLTFTNKTTGKKIVFEFSPYVDGTLNNLTKYHVFLRNCGMAQEELDAARVDPKVLSIPSSIKRIGNDAFRWRSILQEVTIEDGVEILGDYAFEGCRDLIRVTIPGSVNSISYSAFYDCTKLTQVMIGEGVKSIGNHAFEGCEHLTGITIPRSVNSIGNSAFYDCKSLQRVTIPGSVKSIGYDAFKWCIGLNHVIIEDGVESIGDSAFYQCEGLTEITIPDSVKSIGNSAFEFCTNLQRVTIPNSVTSIGKDAFDRCSSDLRIEYNGEVYTTVDSFMKAFNAQNNNR